MKALLLIMLGGVLVNNYALEKFLGVGPVLGGRKYGSTAMGFSGCLCCSARNILRR